MAKREEQKTIDVNKASLYDMFDYLCGKVDWSKSYLDANAVFCMNTLFNELQKTRNEIVKV